MSEWSEGYVTDIGYTYGYYHELNPLRMRMAFLQSGLAAPEVKTACELGFGQGMSVNVHAAASEIDWYGTDFNPGQVAFAQHLAAASGARAALFEDSFAEFAQRDDLPDFDYIGLHGIWSWIDDKNRGYIVDFIRRKLKVGGVLYVSYNTLPGWASMVPFRDLLTAHSEIMGVHGHGIVSRIDQSLAFAEKLLGADPAFARANPGIAKRLESLKSQNRHYLAHEYFNRDWLPMSFAKLADWLAPAKLTYACSAHFYDLVDNVNLTQAQQEILSEIPDALFRETVRDFMVNQQFRKDYWVKGARQLTPLEQYEALRSQRVLLTQTRENVSLKFSGALGEITMQEAVYNPILDALADYRPRTLGQLEQAVAKAGIGFGQIRQSALLLAAGGYLSPIQEDGAVAKVKKQTDKLNYALCDKARSSANHATLASPVLGGGVTVGRFAQLFLLARAQGLKTPGEWVNFAWQTMLSQGQVVMKDDKTLQTEQENLAELTEQVNFFTEKSLPILKAVGIV